MLELPAIIGHRGAAAFAPENTLEGFALAARLGCAMVEFDTRLTADGVPIVFHDDHLDRTTALTGPVAACPLAQLRRHAPQVPILAEVLDLCRSLGLAVNIEIKPDRGAEAATAGAALRVARDLWDRPVLVSSFAPRALAVAAEQCPSWPRGLLVGRVTAGTAARALTLGCEIVAAEHSRLTAERITILKKHDLRVLAYTVNRTGRADHLLQRGVSALFSDRPDLLAGKSAAMS
ncbi:glycerophosphodiester phosphodiesterase family protein [Magnetospirillum moscoviense]|uniref:GP-PDE domain-containing protein n=1 Tax=Magnetospirillum moscoviense TaxID=1437059 RepID=A0A178MN67_9PROT|nr:glycerophosphodiester phosphodiesterase family protein [Magnetospirillum moscoviense]OAN49538.1 hypothetical protein A6A05_13640 [Magnetospirillum moscoviense]